MRNVTQVLADIPAVPERVDELAVTVPPKHLGERLTHGCPGGDRLSEHGVRVGHIERQDNRSTADRRGRENVHLRELVSDVKQRVAEPQLERHQPPVGYRYPVYLLGTERVRIERGRTFGTPDHEMRGDRHGANVRVRRPRILNVLASTMEPPMAEEQVRIWRPGEQARVMLMAGQTTEYALRPRGEYVFGTIAARPMHAHRGREMWLAEPGQLVAWDPSDTHSGTAVDSRPWKARLMVVELTDLIALVQDSDRDDVLSDAAFPEPVLSDPELAARFLRLHAALDMASTRLEGDEQLTEWLRDVVERHSTRRRSPRLLTAHEDRALRLAVQYLAEHFRQPVGLDELAAAAGLGKFRLIRLFRQELGLAPHALQIAYRIRAARRLLEGGETIAMTAAATGFADQSHLHRHFQATIGWTPRQYQRRVKTR